jgi:hypothetical protein
MPNDFKTAVDVAIGHGAAARQWRPSRGPRETANYFVPAARSPAHHRAGSEHSRPSVTARFRLRTGSDAHY